jgi:hypothetical protein
LVPNAFTHSLRFAPLAPLTPTDDTIKGKNPSCPCTKSEIALGEFVDVDLKVDELCDLRLPVEDPAPTSDMGVDFKTPIVGVNRLCDVAVDQAAAKTTTIKESQMANPTVLSLSNLNETVRVLVQNTIRNAKSDFNLVMTTKSLFDEMQMPALAAAAAAAQPAGYQPGCSADWNTNTLDVQNEQVIVDAADFWTQHFRSRCSNPHSNFYKKMLAKSPAERLQTMFAQTCDSLQLTLNLQTAFYAECETIEVAYTNKSQSRMDKWSFLIKDGLVPKVKPGAYHTIREAANNAFLDPSAGVRKIHFDKYFQSCAPTTCTYPELRPPSLGELILLTLALVGGLNGLIKLGVGIFVDTIQALRRKLNGDAETDPETPPSPAKGETDIEVRTLSNPFKVRNPSGVTDEEVAARNPYSFGVTTDTNMAAVIPVNRAGSADTL